MLITATSSPQRIRSGSAPGIASLINYDLANEIWWDTDSGVSPETSLPLDPLATVGLPEGQDTWIVTAGPDITAYLVPGTTTWTPSPAKVAASISALGLAQDTSVKALHATGQTIAQESSQTGVPALRGAGSLYLQPALSLPPGQLTILNDQPLTGLCLVACISLQLPANAGTVPFASVILHWMDANGSVTFERALIAAGNGTGQNTTIYVPVRGETVTVILDNLDPAQVMTAAVSVTETAEQISDIMVVETNLQQVNGFTRPAANVPARIIASIGNTIGPGGRTAHLAPASSGKASLSIDNSAGNNSLYVALSDPDAIYNMTGQGQFASRIVAALAVDLIDVELPNGPVSIEAVNLGTTGSITPSITLTAATRS